VRLTLSFLLCAAVSLMGVTARAASSFIGNFQHIRPVGSTVPNNGDVNPYGVAISPVTKGKLVGGNILVSNFNNQGNSQGTGTTIVQISPSGKVTLFAELNAATLPGPCPGGVGLSTALVVLRSGWVIVGSLPTSDGTSATAQAGCLIVLNDQGTPIKTFSGGSINGPWDMTAFDGGSIAFLFVTNVLNGTVAAGGTTVNEGTVVRIFLLIPNQDDNDKDDAPFELARTTIASGFGERTDPAALVIGPTGVGLGSDGTLYVADTLANRIAAIPQALFRINSAGTGTTVSEGGSLNAPLGLVIAPNRDILTVNGGDGNMVETTTAGVQAAVQTLDSTPVPPGPPGSGALFGLAVTPGGDGVYFVDDISNTLDELH
jgi:hypothetical protein